MSKTCANDTVMVVEILVLLSVYQSIYLSYLASCQENARAVLSSHLRDCYSDPMLLNRNNLPPTTLPVLIDIIRKIEDYPGTVADMRQLSTGILHMFRQDGIVHDPSASGTLNILPYSPTGFQAYKNRLLLSKLLPNNQFRFPNASLTPADKCTLHNMISSTISMEARGDESILCPQSAQANVRFRRSQPYKKHMRTDVEVFDVNGAVDFLGQQILGTSTCPLEYGVISTPWGSVAVGPLIAGISAALEPQQVLISDLVRVKDGFALEPTTRVSNVHSATIAGDLAEAAMRQGTNAQITTIGATGFWNSTNARRHYFLSRNTKLEITDAEIRGGIDGLILGDLGSSYDKDVFDGLKLSQLLEMYYSEKGTMHDTRFRACLRHTLITSVTSTDTLRTETFGFSIALYTTMPLDSTLTLTGVENIVNNTVNSFYNYVAQSINDTACSVFTGETIRPRINLILVTAPTVTRYPVISYLLEQIDVSTHGSSITLLDPRNGKTLIDKTHSLSQFHQDFARISVIFETGTINLTSVLQSIRSMVSASLVLETAAHYSGGNASAVLFLVDNVPLNSDEIRDANFLAAIIRQQAPDLRLIFATSSAAADSLHYIVRDSGDFIPVTLSGVTPSALELAPVVTRLREIPRRIINPLCSTHWLDLNSGTEVFEEFVDVDGINLYSVHPNYFYKDNPARAIRVQSAAYGTVNVCYSRSDPFPRRNRMTSTISPGVTCDSVSAAGSMEMSLGGACEGYTSIEECPPFYITVSSTTTGRQPQCRDAGCRLPNDLKYSIAIQQLGCYSSVSRILGNSYHLTLVMFILHIFLLLFTHNYTYSFF